MCKALLLTLCATLALLEEVHGGPINAEEKWKPLSNPRNRDLFFKTLQAYFSGRGLDAGRLTNAVSLDNERPLPISFYSDPIASAFVDYEVQKNSISNDIKG
ncbi:uncharacterized protein C2orf66 homolog [Microcaecilia unicolor]|uniref:Uncharacterized protein C2orf66 homolog n=1 Tax=Microcaecilia unicolor TaxID=1415580 RepID=A0A6P7YBI8_9AMPH|nr:uncharacterized protein C2orf66 homolog [Microcaecilia unicolor]